MVSFRWFSKIRAAGFSSSPGQDRHYLRLSETCSVNQTHPSSSHTVPLSSAPREQSGLVCTIQTAGLADPLMVGLSTEESRKEITARPQEGEWGTKENGGVRLKQKLICNNCHLTLGILYFRAVFTMSDLFLPNSAFQKHIVLG